MMKEYLFLSVNFDTNCRNMAGVKPFMNNSTLIGINEEWYD